MLSLVLRSWLEVEVLDMSGIEHFPQGSIPPLPQKSSPAALSLWDIETHVRIKIVSAVNVNAGDLMKVCQLFAFLFHLSSYRKRPCISRTFFHKIEAKNQGCGLSTDTSVFGVLKNLINIHKTSSDFKK